MFFCFFTGIDVGDRVEMVVLGIHSHCEGPEKVTREG
jgi:hypothetical protein